MSLSVSMTRPSGPAGSSSDSESESCRLRALFRAMDTNGDGRLDPQELTEGLRRMGYAHITQEHIQVTY